MKKKDIKSIKQLYRKEKTQPVNWTKQQLWELNELTTGEDKVAVAWILSKKIFGDKSRNLIGKAMANIRNGVPGWEIK